MQEWSIFCYSADINIFIAPNINVRLGKKCMDKCASLFQCTCATGSLAIGVVGVIPEIRVITVNFVKRNGIRSRILVSPPTHFPPNYFPPKYFPPIFPPKKSPIIRFI
jgi:hypothetical protein